MWRTLRGRYRPECWTPAVRGSGALLCCGGHFAGMGPLVPLEGRVTADQYKVILSDHLYHLVKHFYPDGSGLFQDIITHHPIKHLWEILDQRVRQCSPPPSPKHQMREYLLEERCSSLL